MEKIVFYDITSQSPRKCWSPNLWRARMVLNFKSIDYETRWVEYPDIEPLLKSLGVGPNPNSDGASPYSLPVIQLQDGRFIVDSVAIARTLDQQCPDPPLHLDDEKVTKIAGMIPRLTKPIFSDFIAKLPQRIMTERSADYFVSTREKMFGKKLSQIEEEGSDGSGWTTCQEAWNELILILKETDGPFFLGTKSSFADIAIVCWLQFFKRVSEQKVFNRVLSFDPSIGSLYQACEKWLERDD